MDKIDMQIVLVDVNKGVLLGIFADVISCMILSEINITLLKATV